MKITLPLGNWSLRRLLQSEPDTLTRAKISIMYTLIVMSMIKLLIGLVGGLVYQQEVHTIRIIFFFIGVLICYKLLLSGLRYINVVGLAMILIGLALIWSNILLTSQDINIITIQSVVMVILSGFYLLKWRWAVFFSALSILPILILFVFGPDVRIAEIHAEKLSSPAYEIIVILNFVTLVVSHYLYYHALQSNIDEKGWLNEQLQAALTEARFAAQSKSDFLSTMSHELRTPLNSVIGMSQLLSDPANDHEKEDNLRILTFSAKNLQMLINDILDFSKMESGKLQLEMIRVNLEKLSADIFAGLKQQADEKGLHLVMETEGMPKGLQVITDPTRMTQIIYNLLGNAIKFTPSGMVKLSMKVQSRRQGQIDLRFSVSDTGIGIEPSKQERIFEAFTQASTSTTRKFGGSGLGLTIVKKLLILFGSEIQLRSEPGKGSDFYFDMRFETAEAAVTESAPVASTTFDLSSLRVLIAEDNPINSLLMKKIFANWNNEPDFALNGIEALQKIEECLYDIVLMDIHMPVLDGYQATTRIRAMVDPARASIPVLALTASVSDDLMQKIKEAGMDDCLSKPFHFEDLAVKLSLLCHPGKILVS